MEVGEGFNPTINQETPRQIAQPNQPQNPEQVIAPSLTYREICQQLVQNPNYSHLFEKYQINFTPGKKLTSLFELKTAMMSKYGVQEPTSSDWDHAGDYELYTGLSATTAKNFEVLSEYIGLEQAIIITETHLPDPFTKPPSIDALKKYIIFRMGKYIDTPEKIDKFISRHPPDSEDVRIAKNIDKIGGFCDSSRRTIVVSPSVTN